MFNRLVSFISRITKIEEQFIKFLFVGVLNTVFGYTIYAFFVFIGLGYPLSLLFATIAGILFNFKTTGTIVFNNKKNILLFKFILSYVIMYLISLILFKIIFVLITNLYVIQIVIIIITIPINFILNKNFVFKK